MELSNISKTAGLLLLGVLLNANAEELLNKQIEDAGKKGIERLVLDFRPVDHMDSVGASNLIKLTAIAKRKKIKLFAYGLNKRYREIFALTSIDKAIIVLDEAAYGLTNEEFAGVRKKIIRPGRQSDAGWAPYVERLKITERPEGALKKNMDNRRVLSQICGFGKMWQKTFWLMINKLGLSPMEVISILKQHFVEFQIPENAFYPTSKGITPGELVFIDSETPGGVVSTGVYVLYADETSFTYITPQGHPEAGWITFSAREQGGAIRMQIQGLVRSSDPFYEIAYAIAGQKFQEKIWLHVLTSLANHLGIEDNGQMVKYKPAVNIQWSKFGNLWYNAQIRSLPLNITRLFSSSKKSGKK